MKRSLAVLLTVIALCGSFACASAATVDYVEVTKASSIRDQAGYGGKRIVLAQAGERYAYLGELNGWYKVRVDASTDGYLPASCGRIVQMVVFSTPEPAEQTAAPTAAPTAEVTAAPTAEPAVSAETGRSFLILAGFVGASAVLIALFAAALHVNKKIDFSYRPSLPGRRAAAEPTGSRSGGAYVRFVASQLRKMGYRRISLTPRRGDGGADIICYDSEGRKTAVQCRCGGTPVGKT